LFSQFDERAEGSEKRDPLGGDKKVIKELQLKRILAQFVALEVSVEGGQE